MSQKKASRRGQSSRRSVEEEMEEAGPSQTQSDEQSQGHTSKLQRSYESLDESTKQTKMREIVRYLLLTEKKKHPVRKQELVSKVMSDYSKLFSYFFEEAKKELRKVFGMEAREVVRGKSKYYLLVSCISPSHQSLILKWRKEECARTGLLSVVLSLILMKQGQITEDQLWHLLAKLGLSPDHSRHPIFANVGHIIKKEFVEQMYLDREKTTAGESYVFKYRWGARAEEEVDKRGLLSFTAELYGGDLSLWETQFRDVLENTKPMQGVRD